MKTRRALSTVVGMTFAIIALTSTVTYITYSMNTLSQYNQAVLQKNQQVLDINKEKFQISNIAVTNNKLNITVTNTGTLPINFTKLWIQNATAMSGGTDWTNNYVPKNGFVVPGSTLKNIGQDPANPFIRSDKVYNIKLVTSRGNAQQFSLNSVISSPLNIQLYALPSTVSSGFTTELVMVVTNNGTNPLVNVVPQLQYGSGSASVIPAVPGQASPPSYNTLPSGGTAIFKWDVTVSGSDSQTRMFTASLQNGYTGNTASISVKVVTVYSSLQSGTAIQSFGLSTTTVPITQLVLHNEAPDYPNTMKELWNGSPEKNAQTSLYTGTTQSMNWITNNDSVVVNVNAGQWNASLRYVSDKIPSTISGIGSAADLIYHFETFASSKTLDSSGNGADLTLVNGAFPANGVNNTNTFTFSSTQNMSRPIVAGHSDVVNPTASTAGWFKTSSSSPFASKQEIFRIGNQGNSKPFYEIYLNTAGNVVFSYSGKSDGSSAAVCTSAASTYGNTQWHHFVAVKTAAGTCSLYVDSASAVTGGSSCSSCSNAPTSRLSIGLDGSGGGQSYFSGTIDDIIHWNNYKLTQSQVTNLLHTSYGSNAHIMSFTLEHDQVNGQTPIETIYSNNNYPLPFYDPVVNSGAAWASNVNFTTGYLNAFKFNSQERLKFTTAWQSGLNMTIRYDDSTLTNPSSSYLQTPYIDSSFPGYLLYSKSKVPILFLANSGPYPSWVSFLTRLSYTNAASSATDSYGAMISTVNNTWAVTPYTDGPLMRVGNLQNMSFSAPMNPPCTVTQGNPCNTGYTAIPTGVYRLSAFLSGYDNTGNLFIHTLYLGPVKVIP